MAAQFAGGTGEPNDPYRIATAEQLISIGSDPNLLNGHFVLVNDIDLDPNLPGGRVFDRAVIAPVAGHGDAYEPPANAFTGSFDGQGHVIRNLTSRERIAGFLGLFGGIGETGYVRNVGLEGVRLSSTYGAGALAFCSTGTIENCWAAGEIRCRINVGGLVQENYLTGCITRCHAHVNITAEGERGGCLGGLVNYNTGTIACCYATGSVTCGNQAACLGGLVALTGQSGCFMIGQRGLIVNCFASGTVSAGGSSECIGGLVGSNQEGTIANCYATSVVVSGGGSRNVGGLVGQLGAPGGDGAEPGYHMGVVINSYAAGSVVCDGKTCGGLVGSIFDGTVVNGSWDMEVTGRATSAGGTGLSTAQMRDARVFRDAGWDWTDESDNGTADLWSMPKGGGYPLLTVFSDTYERPVMEGSGTPDDPYQIATPQQLGAVCHYSPSAHYALVADIDLAGITWSAAPVCDLHGRFDGRGFTVVHLKVRGGSHAGLFGVLGALASVAGLSVEDADIAGAEHGSCQGVLAGESCGHIARCRVSGGLVTGCSTMNVGGLAGAVMSGDVTQCGADVNIVLADDVENVGGLIGECELALISNCYARGMITSVDSCQRIGGLIGENWARATANCYAAVAFIEEPRGSWTGDLAGLDLEGTTRGCYFLANDVSGEKTWMVGTPLMSEEMKLRSSFVGWDFDQVWMICEGKDYPRLRWEQVECK